MDIKRKEAVLGILDRLVSGAEDHASALREAATALRSGVGYRGQSELTYAQFARRLIADRRARTRHFDIELLGEPTWDILLDLFVSQAEARSISVSSLCIVAGVPPTSALRWIVALEAKGLLCREPDTTDRRKVYLKLSAAASDGIQAYLDSIAGNWAVSLRAD